MEFLDVSFVKALFALYIVTVSLVRLLYDREFVRLTAMKKIWGRSHGLLIHFLSNVILPLMFAIFYLCRGITSFVPL
ncbi:MAG TPA: hypothetical protein VJ974_08395 [Geopsychrobacteraceae bacterium]|nr:hypothetical protein [Geopsychrobacteraceae bacterium]